MGMLLEKARSSTIGVDREMIPVLLTKLVAEGVAIYRVTPHKPSLEDVYFALHDQEVPL